jgi:hypothetical protein
MKSVIRGPDSRTGVSGIKGPGAGVVDPMPKKICDLRLEVSSADQGQESATEARNQGSEARVRGPGCPESRARGGRAGVVDPRPEISDMRFRIDV